MSNLCIHAGGQLATLSEIQAVETPEPTDSWCPVSHAVLIDRISDCLSIAGLTATKAQYCLAKSGNRFFGIYDLASTITPSVGLSLGFRNSHDKSMSTGCAVGSRVFVCDNLAMHADYTFFRRHTAHILRNLDDGILRVLNQLGAFCEVQKVKIEALQNILLDYKDVCWFLIRSWESDIVNSRELREVLDSWNRPPHPEFEPRTAWSLLNSYTEAAKARFLSNPFEADVRTRRLSNFFDREFGLIDNNQPNPGESDDTIPTD